MGVGVRIQHPTERNCMFVLVDQSRRYPEPFACEQCAQVPGQPVVHAFKTYHLRLDEAGACIVSPEIVERLKRLRGHGFAIVNEVARPPAQRVVPGVILDRAPIVAHAQLKEPI
jgi:hypothetical protein